MTKTTKKEMLKNAVRSAARNLISVRETTPEVNAPSYSLVEDISKSYELKVLQEELRQLKSLVEDLVQLGMNVSPMNLAKIEVMEARIVTIKKAVSNTNRVDNIVKKAVEARYQESISKIEGELSSVETLVNEEVSQAIEEITTELKPLALVVVSDYEVAMKDEYNDHDILYYILDEVSSSNDLNSTEYEILSKLVNDMIKGNST